MSHNRSSPERPKAGLPVDETLLSTIGLTNHALKQFVARAQPGPDFPGEDSIESDARAKAEVKKTLQHLMLAEGQVTYERPPWSRSSTGADWYVQIGEFLLCIIEWDGDHENWGCWTVVNGSNRTWKVALERGWTKVPLPAAKPARQKRAGSRRPEKAHPRQPERARPRQRPPSRPQRRPSPAPPRPPAPAGPAPHRRSPAVIGGVAAVAVLGLAAWLFLTLADAGREDRASDALAVGTLQQTRDVGRLDLSENEIERILAKTGEVEVRLGDDGEGLRSDLACGESEAWRLTDRDTIDVCVLVNPDSGRLLGSFERVRSKPRLVGVNCRGQAVMDQVRCRDR